MYAKYSINQQDNGHELLLLQHFQSKNTWGGGVVGIRLKVSFQPFRVASTAAIWIRWCLQVYADVGVVR